MEMEFIVKEKMQSLAKERWASKVPAILKQAKVEAIHRARLATVIQESQDGNGKICNKDMFNLDIKKIYILQPEGIMILLFNAVE